MNKERQDRKQDNYNTLLLWCVCSLLLWRTFFLVYIAMVTTA